MIKVGFDGPSPIEGIRQALEFVATRRAQTREKDEDPVAKKAREDREDEDFRRRQDRANRGRAAV